MSNKTLVLSGYVLLALAAGLFLEHVLLLGLFDVFWQFLTDKIQNLSI